MAVRIAAAGDVHCRESDPDTPRREFAALNGAGIDLVLLAGDLTTHGEPEQGAMAAAACREVDAPVLAVLGNHDWHADRAAELVEVLAAAGVIVLDRSTATLQAGGVEVGVVGLKGFVGGFAGSHLPDFGEPLLRAVYREASADVEALDRGLREVALCPLRLALLHYAPTEETLEGEPRGIHAFLGTDRLAAPIREHEPDLVLHGHAHRGVFEASLGPVPIRNVAVHVTGKDFELFRL